MNYAHTDYLIEPDALAGELEAANLRLFDATVHLVPAAKGYRKKNRSVWQIHPLSTACVVIAK